MKHIQLFESMGEYMEESKGPKFDELNRLFRSVGRKPFIFCISGDNGSAVGMLSIDDQKILVDALKKNRDMYDVKTFVIERDGSFVVLTGKGDWKFVEVGETYIPEEGDTQFTILEDGQMLAAFSGAETFWMIDSLSNILPEL